MANPLPHIDDILADIDQALTEATGLAARK
jgi:hypothetical protein